MPDETEEWTPGLRKLWAETWEQPHMKVGLEVLRKKLRPQSLPIVPGYDALVLAAGAFHNSVGKHEVLDLIKSMGNVPVKRQDLPEPWSQEALDGLVESKPTPQ